MKTYAGNIVINKENCTEWNEKLKEIRIFIGDLYIDSDGKLTAPNLETVKGSLEIDSDGKLTAPNLERNL